MSLETSVQDGDAEDGLSPGQSVHHEEDIARAGHAVAQARALLQQTPTQDGKANIDGEEEIEDDDIGDNVNNDLLHVRLAALTSAGIYCVSLPPQVK